LEAHGSNKIKKNLKFRDPNTSEEYMRWIYLTMTIVHRMPHSEVGPSQVVEELIKRKKKDQ
jgi:hypothetical protein